MVAQLAAFQAVLFQLPGQGGQAELVALVVQIAVFPGKVRKQPEGPKQAGGFEHEALSLAQQAGFIGEGQDQEAAGLDQLPKLGYQAYRVFHVLNHPKTGDPVILLLGKLAMQADAAVVHLLQPGVGPHGFGQGMQQFGRRIQHAGRNVSPGHMMSGLGEGGHHHPATAAVIQQAQAGSMPVDPTQHGLKSGPEMAAQPVAFGPARRFAVKIANRPFTRRIHSPIVRYDESAMSVEISVVIPTYNMEAFLGACLEGLRQQGMAAERFEIVIVDDGSTDGTPALIEQTRTTWAQDRQTHPEIRLIQQANSGPGAARNNGIASARGGIIALLDSDCVPDPGWLAGMTEPLLADAQLAGVEGQTVPLGEVTNLFDHVVENRDGGHYFTCNMAYRKSILLAVGGLDENLRWCEDIDLAYRVKKLGDIHFNPQAVIRHQLVPWPFKKHFMLARTIPYLLYTWKKDPGAILPPDTSYLDFMRFQMLSNVKCLWHKRDWISRAPLQYLKYIALISLWLIDTLIRTPYYYWLYRQPIHPKEPLKAAQETAAP